MKCAGFSAGSRRNFWLNYLIFVVLFVNAFAKSKCQSSEEIPVLVPVLAPSETLTLESWRLAQTTISKSRPHFTLEETVSTGKDERLSSFDNDLKRVTYQPVSSPNYEFKRVARRLAPNISSTPDSASPPNPTSNSSLAPTGLVQPPVSPHTACCGPNMVPRRTNLKDCIVSNCVYPIKLEFFLRNVSLTSNFSDKFLDELSSQLGLKADQFEIDNFYVVGASGLNISMDVVPQKGVGFDQNEVYKLNGLLGSHKVKINPDLVGDYALLNFTWFHPLAPTPAPSLSMSPMASPPSKVPRLPVPSRNSEDNTSKNNDSHSSLLIIIGVCVGLLIVIFVVIMIICACSYGKSKNISDDQDPETGKPMTARDAMSARSSLPRPTSTRFISFEELTVATNNFDASYLLGEGGFGQVFKGVLSDGTAVAIKRLTSGGHQGDKEFLVEVEMLSRLHHRNLVKLVGYFASRDESEGSLLCYELVPNGSLEAWLHGPLGQNCALDWEMRMKIALDAARGLAYLHEDSQPCVIHRDFKSSNILLENDFHAKVSDFGLAKQAPEGQGNHLSTRVMGTFGYVAPEYAMTGHLLVKSDVYSYGVVLLELLTGKRPVDHLQPLGQENLVTWARPVLRDKERLAELADPKMEGKYPKDDFSRVCTIAAACVSLEASQRPTMGEVVQSLKMVQPNYNNNNYNNNNNNNNNNSSGGANNNSHDNNNNVNGNNNNTGRVVNYESDETSSMFSSSPFSGLSVLDNDNVNRVVVFSEDLHEGR